MAYVVASVFFFGVITFVTVCTEVDWNYTPRREYPYINAESKM
jgi:hypothetical protein